MPGPGSVACPKRSKGTLVLERYAKRTARRSHEKAVKLAVLRRDGRGCRWPHCPRGNWMQVEAAHLEPAGMGGDPTGSRMQTWNLIRLCVHHHQGAQSVHSGDLRIEPRTWRGTDGPCRFYAKMGDQWIVVGIESRPSVFV